MPKSFWARYIQNFENGGQLKFEDRENWKDNNLPRERAPGLSTQPRTGKGHFGAKPQTGSSDPVDVMKNWLPTQKNLVDVIAMMLNSPNVKPQDLGLKTRRGARANKMFEMARKNINSLKKQQDAITLSRESLAKEREDVVKILHLFSKTEFGSSTRTSRAGDTTAMLSIFENTPWNRPISNMKTFSTS